MAGKASAPSVEYAYDEASGFHAIGVSFGGVFVPFARVTSHIVTQAIADAGGASESAPDTTEEAGT